MGNWIVDIENVTCTCPDFKFRRFKHAKHSEERRCKHLKEAMVDIPVKASKTWSEKKRHPRTKVEIVAKMIEKILSKFGSIDQFEFCGSFRRKKETIGDLDIVISKSNDNWIDNDTIIKQIEMVSSKTLINGNQKTSVVVYGIQVDIRFVKQINYITQVAHATGSKEHNIRLRAIAKSRGMTLNEYGLFRGKIQVEGIKKEEDIYKILNIPYTSPENR